MLQSFFLTEIRHFQVIKFYNQTLNKNFSYFDFSVTVTLNDKSVCSSSEGFIFKDANCGEISVIIDFGTNPPEKRMNLKEWKLSINIQNSLTLRTNPFLIGHFNSMLIAPLRYLIQLDMLRSLAIWHTLNRWLKIVVFQLLLNIFTKTFNRTKLKLKIMLARNKRNSQIYFSDLYSRKIPIQEGPRQMSYSPGPYSERCQFEVLHWS